MSVSMPIPKRKQPVLAAASSSSSYASASSSYSSPRPAGAASSPTSTPKPSSKGKEKVTESPTLPSPSSSEWISHRRPSLLGRSFTKSEYTVINLGHSDGPPRLVTCVKSSQGFDWNQELFLPSYIENDSHDLEHRPDPVEDIILTDEEAAAIFPQ